MTMAKTATDEGEDYAFSIGKRSDTIRAEYVGGVIRMRLGDVVLEVEAYRRPGYPLGLYIRGLDCSFDVEPKTDNTIIVKPRR